VKIVPREEKSENWNVKIEATLPHSRVATIKKNNNIALQQNNTINTPRYQ